MYPLTINKKEREEVLGDGLPLSFRSYFINRKIDILWGDFVSKRLSLLLDIYITLSFLTEYELYINIFIYFDQYLPCFLVIIA